MTALQYKETMKKEKSERMMRLAKLDNKSVGDFSGMKSSFKDASHSEEHNAWMSLK